MKRKISISICIEKQIEVCLPDETEIEDVEIYAKEFLEKDIKHIEKDNWTIYEFNACIDD